MRRFVSFGPALVVILAVLVTLVAAPSAMRRADVARIEASVTLAQHRLDSSATLMEQLNQATRDVAQATLPGVVHIQVRTGDRPPEVQEPRGDENEDRRQDEPRERPRRMMPRASAAGWIYSSEGFIVTNAHVVDGADELRVELYDGRVRTAEVIGTDAFTDIALIRVDPAPGVTPLRRASGNPIAVGDRVFAFGSPFGIKFSMSQGIISGLGRSEAAMLVGMPGGYTNFIQTDAAMNPGNSGGPLVDVTGRVVGMNAAIANNVQFGSMGGAPVQGQSAGIGFAIPLETIESVVAQLMSSKIILRGYMGVSLEDEFTPEIAKRYDLAYDGAGIVVMRVEADQPASKAGLKPNDVIVGIGSQPTPNRDVLRSLVSIREPGETVELKVWRNGTVVPVGIKLGAAYFSGNRFRYIPGSEDLSRDEIMKAIEGQRPPRRND